MKQPRPKALPGDIVLVLNYRVKRCEKWEYGTVLRCTLEISASFDFKKLYLGWAYVVQLERKSQSNKHYGQERGMNVLRLIVSDERIKYPHH